MSEFFGVSTLDPVLLSYYLVLAVLALLGTVVFAYYQAESSFEHGFNCGRSDLDSLIVRAENIGHSKGYREGKDAGIWLGKKQAQPVIPKPSNQAPKKLKTPAKKVVANTASKAPSNKAVAKKAVK